MTATRPTLFDAPVFMIGVLATFAGNGAPGWASLVGASLAIVVVRRRRPRRP